MKVLCKTLFDCTVTGTTGRFRAGELPYKDLAQQNIATQQDWHRSRDQQRNYETLLQIIGLRTQPLNISTPVNNHGVWQFSFETENENVFAKDGDADPFANLLLDCTSVPMVLNLNEQTGLDPVLTPLKNIWFEAINN